MVLVTLLVMWAVISTRSPGAALEADTVAEDVKPPTVSVAAATGLVTRRGARSTTSKSRMVARRAASWRRPDAPDHPSPVTRTAQPPPICCRAAVRLPDPLAYAHVEI